MWWARLLTWLASVFFNRTPPPQRAEVNAERAARAEVQLELQFEGEKKVEKAISAVDELAADRLSSDDREALARAPNRYSRT